MRRKSTVGLNILSMVGIFFILLGLYALSSNIFMKETTGEIIHCSRVNDTYRNTSYWDASARFYVDEEEYYGYVNVNSHKYVGQKIKILYDPKDPSHFISKSSTYVGILIINFGLVFLIPKIQSKLKNNKNKKVSLN